MAKVFVGSMPSSVHMAWNMGHSPSATLLGALAGSARSTRNASRGERLRASANSFAFDKPETGNSVPLSSIKTGQVTPLVANETNRNGVL